MLMAQGDCSISGVLRPKLRANIAAKVTWKIYDLSHHGRQIRPLLLVPSHIIALC